MKMLMKISKLKEQKNHYQSIYLELF